jgi:hypothetical protein
LHRVSDAPFDAKFSNPEFGARFSCFSRRVTGRRVAKGTLLQEGSCGHTGSTPTAT